jgi:hypothetical protein
MSNMPDVNVTSDASTNQVKFHNPAVHPLPSSAGATVTATVKTAGQPNAVVHGQVPGTGVIFDNPAAILLAFTLGSMLKWM